MEHGEDTVERAAAEVRRLARQIGGYTRQARHGMTGLARAGQAGLRAKFEREVDPDGTLDTAERARRTDAALKANMAAMALKGATARWQKARTCPTCAGSGKRKQPAA